MATITLTQNQIEQLLWAIDLTKSSYTGWSKDEMGEDAFKGLQTLKRIETKLLTLPTKTTN